jgi:multidrug efflux pump subunit AcrA (membrane-fusion protein)
MTFAPSDLALRCAGLAVAGLVALSGCSSDRAGAAQPSPSPSPSPVDVQAVQATFGTLRPALTIPGAIAPFQTVALSNSITEPAAAVNVQEGDHVRRGQVLAQLAVDDLEASLNSALQTAQADQSRLAEAGYNAQLTFAQAPQQVRASQASVQQAKATLDEAVLNLKRDQQLVSQGYLPQQNYDEQVVVVRNDQQALASAQATLAQSIASLRVNGNYGTGLQAATIAAARQDEAAQLATAEQLRRQISRASITSPVDGIVINRNLNPGEYPAGRQIFTIEANATVFAILTASAVQAYQIQNGDVVTIQRSGIPNGVFRGTVVAVLDAATAGSTNFTVKVAIPNPNNALRAGTPVQASIALEPIRGVIVPTSAFVDDSHTRLIAIQDGKAEPRHVVEQSTDGANSVVTGLAAGTQVLRSGSVSVDTNQPVRVVQ